MQSVVELQLSICVHVNWEGWRLLCIRKKRKKNKCLVISGLISVQKRVMHVFGPMGGLSLPHCNGPI